MRLYQAEHSWPLYNYIIRTATSAYYQCVLPVRTTSAYYQCVLPVRTTSAYYQCVLPVRTTSAYYQCVLPVRTTSAYISLNQCVYLVNSRYCTVRCAYISLTHSMKSLDFFDVLCYLFVPLHSRAYDKKLMLSFHNVLTNQNWPDSCLN